MAILQFQFFDSYSRMLVNSGEVFDTGPPGCANPLPGRPFQLCEDGQGAGGGGTGDMICPDRFPSLIPPEDMRSDGAQWDQVIGASAVLSQIHEIMLSNTLPSGITSTSSSTPVLLLNIRRI